MVRASKRARRYPISSNGAVAAPLEDNATKVSTLCPRLGFQNTSSDLVQPCNKFAKYRSSYHQQTCDDSLEYARGVLAGVESLGIEMTPRLQRDLEYRHGQAYSLESFSDWTLELRNTSNDGAAAPDIDSFVGLQGYHEAIYDYNYQEDHWGSDYAGVGHQFANSSVGGDKTQLSQ
jgi:hypothetical protein